MHIIIDQYGVKIEVENERFKLSQGEELRFISPMKISSMNILRPCSITSPALILASQHQIPVLMYNGMGRVESMIWSPHYGNIASIRKKQAYFSDSSSGVQWMQTVLNEKFERQKSNLQYFSNRFPSKTNKILKSIQIIDSFNKDCETMEALRAREGLISKIYWQTLFDCIEKLIYVENRSKRNATDVFNMCINYGYGILYGLVESSIIMHGLDPHMGIMHADRYIKPVLAFDQIEPFRPWVDKLVTTLLISKEIKPDDTEINNQKTQLSHHSRKVLIQAFFTMMNERALLMHKRIKRMDHIHYLNNELVQTIKNYEVK